MSLLAHGILMSSAWIVTAQAGTFSARFLKERLADRWFHVHLGCQFLTICLVLAAILFALFDIGWALGAGPHTIIGTIVICLTFLQGFLGSVAHFSFSQTRDRVPMMPDRIHWILGYLLQFLAVSNIGLGLFMWFSKRNAGFWLAIAGYFAFIIHTLLVWFKANKTLSHFVHLKNGFVKVNFSGIPEANLGLVDSAQNSLFEDAQVLPVFTTAKPKDLILFEFSTIFNVLCLVLIVVGIFLG